MIRGTCCHGGLRSQGIQQQVHSQSFLTNRHKLPGAETAQEVTVVSLPVVTPASRVEMSMCVAPAPLERNHRPRDPVSALILRVHSLPDVSAALQPRRSFSCEEGDFSLSTIRPAGRREHFRARMLFFPSLRVCSDLNSDDMMMSDLR